MDGPFNMSRGKELNHADTRMVDVRIVNSVCGNHAGNQNQKSGKKTTGNGEGNSENSTWEITLYDNTITWTNHTNDRTSKG